MKRSLSLACVVAAAFGAVAPAHAFEPSRPVEFIVTAGPGGGTDIFARTIQAIIAKYELMKAPVVVTNKGSAGGAEGFVYTAGYKGDAHKLAFGTNNAYLLPIRAKVPYKAVRTFFKDVQDIGFGGVSLAVGAQRKWDGGGEVD